MKLSFTFALLPLATNGFTLSPSGAVRPFGSAAATTSASSAKTSPRPLFSTESDAGDTSDETDAPMDVPSDVETEVISQPAATTTDSPTTTTSGKNALLQKLLVTAASTDRGQFASQSQKDDIATLISNLEQIPPEDLYAHPTKSPTIDGTWELLYSNTQLFRSSPFFMAGRAVCSTEEEARQYDWFCDMHRAALAISEIGKVRQIIGNGRMVSEFEVNVGSIPFLSDLTPFKYSGGLPFTINGAIVSSADITPVEDGKAWEIFMDQVEIKGSNIPLLRKLLDDDRVALKSRDLGSFLEENVNSYSNPKPIFTTTYLDDMIRISRDQDGKIFVYAKMTDETEPTVYKNESDLGLINLLEGLNDTFFKFSI